MKQVFTPTGNHFLFSPSLESSPFLKKEWEKTLLTDHVFITSSGTTGHHIKSYALSKKALIYNAHAVNHLLDVSKHDRWLGSLPHIHVGGLSIYVRANLTQSEVIPWEERWNPLAFNKKLQKENIQFTSLIPTQLFDLVKNDCLPPSSLKGILIGGDHLNTELKKDALKKNWPLFETYGMTETCSQIATSKVNEVPPFENGEDYLEVLPLHKVKIINQRLAIQGPSLFTAKILFNGHDTQLQYAHELTQDDFFVTEDLAEISTCEGRTYLKPLGRGNNEIKIKGHLVSLSHIKRIFSHLTYSFGVFGQMEIVPQDDLRDGKRLELWTTELVQHLVPEILGHYHSKVLKPYRVSYTRSFEKLPRTSIGKLKLTKSNS